MVSTYTAPILCLLLVSACTATQPPSHSTREVGNEIEKLENKLRQESNVREKEQLDRLSNLIWPIVARNIELCGKHVMFSAGFEMVFSRTNSSNENSSRDNEPTTFESVNGMRVTRVINDSPAHRLGLRVDDVVTALGGFKSDQSNPNEFHRSAKNQLAALVRKGEPFELAYSRDREQYEGTLIPQKICLYELEIRDSSAINASTNGRRIAFNRGLLEAIDDETFLQAVFAHELAHGIHKHPRKLVPRAAVGLVLDVATLSRGIWTGGFFSSFCGRLMNKELEREADYVAYYLLANAGLDFSKAYDAWADVAVKYKGGVKKSITHPSHAERLVMQDKIAEEIQRKIDAREPLIPNR